MMKTEVLTSLYGNQLTEKDNPMIVFRGKLDTLCAMILEAQVLGEEKKNSEYVNDLQEILEFIRKLFQAEYKGIEIGDFRLLGITPAEIREQSHNPQKYFGRKHLLMHHTMGALSIRLNYLRTVVREVEIAAVAALRDKTTGPLEPSKCLRQDIVDALNRLSSLFYILIYKYLDKDYSPAGEAGI